MKFQNIIFNLSEDVRTFISKNYNEVDKRDFIITSFLIYKERTNRDWNLGLSSSFFGENGEIQQTSLPLKCEFNFDLPFKKALESCQKEIDILNLKAAALENLQSTSLDSFRKNEFSILIKKATNLSQPVIDYNNGLTMIISEDLDCKLVYNENVWKTEDIQAIISHLQVLHESIIRQSEEPIKLLRLLSDEDWKKVIYDWNDYTAPYPRDKTIVELFESCVEKNPDSIAVVYENHCLTYRQLNEKANQLANYLVKNGVVTESIVAICIERSLEMIVGLMGILKAGASYVPLDMNYPNERLEYMLEMTEAPFIITLEKWKSSLPSNHKALILLDSDKEIIARESITNPPHNINALNLSCVLFTSGSTGKPKGVCLPHRGVVRLVHGTNYVSLNEDTIMMGVTTLAFDPSLLEVWGSLTNGGQLVLVPSMHPSMSDLKELVKKHQINTIFLSTALMHLFIEQDLSELTCLKHLMTGGDVYSLTHAKKAKAMLPSCMVMNGYGPTENTTYSSFFEIKEDNLIYPTVPIGIPISNSQMYVLDKWLQPLPIGVPGELYNAGDGLARGYLKRPDLTAERFLPNPFHPELSPYMYKTGDQARYFADGNVEFMGRFDNQVKVRGIRIELGEIEAAIKLFPGVSESVVIANGTNANDKQLYGYVVAIQGQDFSIEELKKYLGEKVPQYMIPPYLTKLDAFPLTPNGKIDKKSLPLPSAEVDNGTAKSDQLLEEGSLESVMVRIWKEILQTNKLRTDDNFFLMGGNSLMAVKLISEIQKQTGYNVPVIAVFAKPTINEFVKYIREELNEASWSSLVPIKPDGNKKPLYCIHPVSGEVDYVFTMARFFDKDQPVYGLQAVGLNGKDPLLTRIEDMAAHYVKLILENDPNGPYHLAGYSMGGIIAYEMAQQLRALGKEVTNLFLFDTYPHKRGKFTYLHFPIPIVLLSFKNYILNPSIALSDKLKFITKKTPELVQHAAAKFKKEEKTTEETHLEEEVSVVHKLKHYGVNASQAYELKPYDGKVVFLRAMDGPAKHVRNHDFGWRKYINNELTIHEFPGGHLDFFLVPSNPENIAKTLARYL